MQRPVRDLSPDLICEYSDSAHGDPIAPDIEVNWTSVGADLRGLGDARGKLAVFPPPGMADELAAMCGGRSCISAPLQARDEDLYETSWILHGLLLSGGWPFATVAAALDDMFRQPGIGRPALAEFLADLCGSFRDGRIELWARSRCRTEVAADLAAWLVQILASDAVADIPTDHALPKRAAVWVPSLAGLRGQLNGGMSGGRTARCRRGSYLKRSLTSANKSLYFLDHQRLPTVGTIRVSRQRTPSTAPPPPPPRSRHRPPGRGGTAGD